MNRKSYQNNYKKVIKRCNWQTLVDFMAIPIITNESHIKRSLAQKQIKIHNGRFQNGHKINIGRKAWNKGIHFHSEENKRKFSEMVSGKNNYFYGKSFSGQLHHNFGKKGLYSGKDNPFYGKKHSEETLKKLRGRKTSIETRKKIGLASKGRHWVATEEFKQKHREMWKNKKAGPFKDTKPERMMQLALTLHGIKYDKHKPFKIGKSWHQVDIFIEPNICVEVDGVYFHLKEKNIQRDLFIGEELTIMGYHLIRIRDKDILKDANHCSEKVIQLIKELREGIRLL